MIFLHQWGGPSHHDTFDMKPAAPAEIRGELKPIATRVPGVQVCERLPRMAGLMDKVTLIRTLRHTMKNHNSAGYYSLTGYAPPTDDQRLRDSRDLFPAYGSVVERLAPAQGRADVRLLSARHQRRLHHAGPARQLSRQVARSAVHHARTPTRPTFACPN